MKKLPLSLRVAVGTLGGLVVAVGVVVITASAVGFDLTGAAHPGPAPAGVAGAATAVPSPSPPVPSGRAQANPAALAVNAAVARAEAQALGVQPRDLVAGLRGAALRQLAARKGVAPAAFQAAYQQDLKTLLDQDVQQGTLTAAQEQAALRRLGGRLPPNWDGPAPPTGPSPTPAA